MIDYVSSAPPIMIESYLSYCKAQGHTAETLKNTRSHLKHYDDVGGDLIYYVLYCKMKGYSNGTIKTKTKLVKEYLRWVEEVLCEK